MNKWVTICSLSSLSTDYKRDKQYKCIMFELIMLLVPKFMRVLSDGYKDPKTFDKFMKEVSLRSYLHI